MLNIKPVRPEVVTVLASGFLLAAFNLPLWRHLDSITGSAGAGWQPAVAFAVMLFGVFTAILTWLALPKLLKPVLITLFMVSAGVTYFMNRYGIMIDAGMLRNTVQTNATEVRDLLSPKLFIYIALLGVLPSALLWRTPIHYRSVLPSLFSKTLVTASCAALITAAGLINYQGLSSMLRNHHELRLLVVPSNYIGASINYLREQWVTAQTPFTPVGEDAVRARTTSPQTRKSLTVLVVGESARAENFSLLGYGRQTNPELSKEQGLVAFTDMHSCGTETAVSVPCMFSNLGRAGYSAAAVSNREGLLDVLKRAGLHVIWRDNQSGCKGTCGNVTVQDVSNAKDPALCADHECRDEILLQGLQQTLDHLDHDTVLVLHQMGSHGPEYYKRYPAAFERFTPVCKSNALDKCSRDSIVNAYDNTLLYTDHVLAQLIDTLRKNQDRVDTAMIYLSDHGESLGEYNLFLHGTPYMLAPDQQKHVPLLVWLSPSYQKSTGLDMTCLEHDRDTPLSQDNLFHSMLGLLNVQTQAYKPALDLFSGCRPAHLASNLPAKALAATN
ncbi:phosphoethanolamine--lipid A transferase [Pseudomonas sp. RP23018S]|uniref:phosphoethanolamine transferase n=1 Tax=Pseudomonas sp. RP23018S TaxID=3096037 RepID=UPI002ACAFDE1|nr:phosphoethanolamine--lipid A transferase [Pseudomonas sp. RP23018S]MDZ5604757.1 phosphoethanolamine--lipid A transferase [Pseudomonas sp. RP23018S]